MRKVSSRQKWGSLLERSRLRSKRRKRTEGRGAGREEEEVMVEVTWRRGNARGWGQRRRKR